MKSSEYARSREGQTRSRFNTLANRTIALAFALAFVLGACDAYAQGGGGVTSGGVSSGEQTLSVTAPANGAEVSVPFAVTVETDASIGPPESGNQHLHLYFDGGTDTADYDIAYSTQVQVSRELAPGEHTILVSLRNADHSDAGASQTITVVVAGSGEIGGENPDPTAPPLGFGY
jgi:hypothetical protein